MKILIVTPHFWPENFRINDFAFEFVNRGHEVSVLTAVPDYPHGQFHEGYNIYKNNREVINNVKIFRAPLIPRGNGSGIRLAINYLSLIIGSILTAINLLKFNYDIVFVYQPSPITIGIPAILIKKFKRIPMVFWVLDLWPESIYAASSAKSRIFEYFLLPIVKLVYYYSDELLVSSAGYIDSIVGKGVPRSKISFFPQWSEDIKPPKVNNPINLPNIPSDAFIIMFAGNIGEAQNFDTILSAAKILVNNRNIHWVILGDGRKSNWVKRKSIELGISGNFHLLGRFPVAAMPDYFSKAHIMLLPLKNEHIFSLTIPAKLQSYFANKKPVLALISGISAKIINDTNSGFVCSPDSPSDIVKAVKKAYDLPVAELTKMGENAYEYYQNNFNREILFNKIDSRFENLINR